MGLERQVAVLLMLPCTLTAQASPYRPVKLQSCLAADSVLGTSHEAARGRIRGYYDRAADMTHLIGGTSTVPEYPSSVMGAVNYLGRGPFLRPALELSILVAGPMGRRLWQTQEPPAVTMAVDDTVPILLSGIKRGRYEGPRDAAIIPINLILHYDAFRTLVASTKATVRVAGTSIRWNDDTHHDVQGLFLGAVCQQNGLSELGSPAPPN